MDANKISVYPIPHEEAIPWLLRTHYAKRKCQMMYVYGAHRNKDLVGVVSYGKPASPHLCMGVCGAEYKDIVIELNRLCCDNEPNIASRLIGRSLRLIPGPAVVVSYADTGQGHIGYIYQATNFLYTGLSALRRDKTSNTGMHSRHYGNYGSANANPSISRPRKHRYVYFIGSKRQKKEMRDSLRYGVEPYPKGESMRYDTGPKVETQRRLFDV